MVAHFCEYSKANKLYTLDKWIIWYENFISHRTNAPKQVVLLVVRFTLFSYVIK